MIDHPASRFRHFSRNLRGRDFGSGDLHGCLRELKANLARAGFDTRVDRLFLTGDLVNKGPHSEEVLDLLAEPWCYSVRGNHDQMVIDACTVGLDKDWHLARGGAWFYALPEARRQRYAEAMLRLPVAIEIDTPAGLVGMVHSEVFGDWRAYVKELTEDTWPVTGLQLLGRRRIKQFDSTPVQGLDMLVVGHSRVSGVIEIGNTYYIDTGCYRTGKLTVLPLDEIRASVVRSYNDQRAAIAV